MDRSINFEFYPCMATRYPHTARAKSHAVVLPQATYANTSPSGEPVHAHRHLLLLRYGKFAPSCTILESLDVHERLPASQSALQARDTATPVKVCQEDPDAITNFPLGLRQT